MLAEPCLFYRIKNVKFLQSSPLIFILFIILIIGVAVFLLAKNASAEIGNIQVFQGSAKIITNGKTSDAKTGQSVKIKDSIKVSKDSRVSIILKDSSVIRLDETTEVEVGQLSYQGQKIKNATFKLLTGRLWSRVVPLEQNGNFEVETPTIVATVRGTSFNTTYSPEISGVYVYKRIVGVALKKDLSKTQTVLAEQLLRMQNDKLDEDFTKGPVTPDPSYFDEWIIFNQSEDDKICRDNPRTPGCENYNFQSSPSPVSSPATASSSPMTSYAKPSVKSTTKPSILGTTTTPTPLSTTRSTQSPTSSISTPTPTFTPTSTPPIKNLVSFNITHDNTQNDCYPNCQFQAWAYFSDFPNKAVDVTKDTKWSLQSPANGTITSSGSYTSGNVRGDTVQGEYNNNQDHGTATHQIPGVIF